MLSLLYENEPWLEWTSLKLENCAAQEYNTLCEHFNKDLDLWIKWSSNCASNKYPFTDSIRLGTVFENKVGVSLD